MIWKETTVETNRRSLSYPVYLFSEFHYLKGPLSLVLAQSNIFGHTLRKKSTLVSNNPFSLRKK